MAVFAGFALVSIAPASATVIWQQGPTTGTYSGSWVNQTASQNFADQFELTSAATVTQYDYFTNFDPSTFGSLDVRLYADASGVPGTLLSSENINPSSYFLAGTFSGTPIYQVDLVLTTPWAVNPGTIYWAGASGNGFEAAQVTVGLSSSPLGDGHMAQFNGPNYSFSTDVGDQDFALEGTPEPASYLAFGLPLLGLGLRRRTRK